ncbi:uncharacterized protein CDV56_104077 [Aspergillus thermomutatus]|uniref:Uncharacterized protein n=1 Tax=Aspergillus thermomutatus TaxID=41047 RepID=A0A397GAP2_ASPTH|nr:uncharacterized protein CDV56_104077 [Aspergillus thermomutatus]RHZ48095.1 hypothetical protein CDV56_104077 [Aspergillus thermomutatus]
MYTLQSGPSLDLCSPDPSITSSALLPSLSRVVSASVPLSTAPKGIRSWPKDRWESIYNFLKDKLHVQRLSLRKGDRLNVELSDEADTSDNINRLDITIASVDSTKGQSSIGMETRAGPTKLHRLASKKTPRTYTPTAAYVKTASSTVDPTPTPSHKSLLPHWSYRKSSIAAAVSIVSITAVALIALTILLIRRLRQSWKRYKKRKRDYANSKYSAISPLDDNIGTYSFDTPRTRLGRESSKFGLSRSTTMPYVAEEATSLGAVTRAICANTNAMPVSPLDSVAAVKQSEVRLPHVSVPERPKESELLTEPWRAGFVPKQVVIVAPPLSRMVSASTAEIGRQSSLRTIDELSLPESETGPQSPHKKARPKDGNQTPSTDELFRLPSIQRVTSPIFEF